MWKLVLVTNAYYYWENVKGCYNVTSDMNPPSNDSGGYYSLDALRQLKNDSDKEN